ncbi:hypothetical protein [Sphingosinicella sp. BN140058]|uniref:hypothetical protein n=1 Tax=Sphingosinicella sp. BN140058 TaxID=1892855 RepID=UPI001011D879|nr:hypothetical protein [Sphingosinicella sp. BN140058]QAY80255.1 hypothetical protein ETR14_26795 [Sphingosinicella sp. BN140058]
MDNPLRKLRDTLTAAGRSPDVDVICGSRYRIFLSGPLLTTQTLKGIARDEIRPAGFIILDYRMSSDDRPNGAIDVLPLEIGHYVVTQDRLSHTVALYDGESWWLPGVGTPFNTADFDTDGLYEVLSFVPMPAGDTPWRVSAHISATAA